MPKVLDHDAYFWSKVQPTGFCWLWTGTTHKEGYGIIKRDRQPWKAHRLAYTLLVGPIADGLELDHLCRIRLCVNPDHLEPVTKRVNVLRGYGTGARFARRKCCPKCQGTDFYVRPDGGRRCKFCISIRTKERRERLTGKPSRKQNYWKVKLTAA